MAIKLGLKAKNRNSVYKLIYNREGISKQDISIKLKLSLPTVSQNLNDLKERNLIEENGTFESTGGRKPRVIRSIDDAKVSLGLDITRNHVSIVMVDLKGTVINSKRLRMEFKDNDEYYIFVGKVVSDFIEENDYSKDKILGLGISLPAIIGKSKKDITYLTVLPAPDNLYEKIKEHIDLNFDFFNDANAGGFAEFWHRDSQEPIVYLSLSNSVGGAIMYSQSAYYGMNHRSGEFGHITLVPEGKTCYCGKKGCADAYCNAKLLSDLREGNLIDFFESLENKDEDCISVFNEYLYYLSQLVYNLRMSFDCDVILGGYVGSHMEKYVNSLMDLVNERNAFEKQGEFIKVCNYKFEASAVGAALYYVDAFIDSI